MEDFVKIECCQCGVLWGVSRELDRNWHKNKQSFYCPNGHCQSYHQSTAEILKEKLEASNIIIRKQEDMIAILETKVKASQKKKIPRLSTA